MEDVRRGPFPRLVLPPHQAGCFLDSPCQIGDGARMSDTIGQIRRQLRCLAERRLALVRSLLATSSLLRDSLGRPFWGVRSPQC